MSRTVGERIAYQFIGCLSRCQGYTKTARALIQLGLFDGLELTAQKDPKTFLQEHLQARNKTRPEYHLVSESGEEHAKVFAVEVAVPSGHRVTAVGRTKRQAEQEAAAAMAVKLGLVPAAKPALVPLLPLDLWRVKNFPPDRAG